MTLSAGQQDISGSVGRFPTEPSFRPCYCPLWHMHYVPPDAGTVLWKHPGGTCTQVIHPQKPAFEIRVYVSTGTWMVTFFDDAESARRYADEQRVRFA